MFLKSSEIALGPPVIPPVGARHPVPPIEITAEVNWTLRFLKRERSGNEQLRVCARISLRIQRSFGHRYIACLIHELLITFVRDLIFIHIESIDGHLMNRFLFWI